MPLQKLFKAISLTIKKLSLASLSILFSFASLSAISYPISQIKSNTIVLQAQDGYSPQIGESAFVISSLQELEYISATLKVTQASDTITLEIIEKNPFFIDKLASINQPITLTDKVQFELYKNKAFVIAPSEEAYSQVAQMTSEQVRDFLSPTIALSFLGSLSVEKKDLQKLAKKYLLSKIYLVQNQKLYTLDAFSLEILAQQPLAYSSEQAKKPFFSHLESNNISSYLQRLLPFAYDKYYSAFTQ